MTRQILAGGRHYRRLVRSGRRQRLLSPARCTRPDLNLKQAASAAVFALWRPVPPPAEKVSSSGDYRPLSRQPPPLRPCRSSAASGTPRSALGCIAGSFGRRRPFSLRRYWNWYAIRSPALQAFSAGRLPTFRRARFGRRGPFGLFPASRGPPAIGGASGPFLFQIGSGRRSTPATVIRTRGACPRLADERRTPARRGFPGTETMGPRLDRRSRRHSRSLVERKQRSD